MKPNGGASVSTDGLGSWRIDLPAIGMDGEKDERSDGVVLLEVLDDENKTTAEDCGSYWQIRDWEVHELLPGKPHWFSRHGYTMDKDMVAKLAALTKRSNAELRGRPLADGPA